MKTLNFGDPREIALMRECLKTNGGPVDGTDSVDYVLVTRSVFEAFDRHVKEYDTEQEYLRRFLASQHGHGGPG